MGRAERQKVILLVLLSALVAYVGYFGLGAFKGVRGLQQEAAKLRAERQELQQQVQSATILVANLDRIKQERVALEAQLRELSRRLPTEHESAEVLRSVESLARRSGLSVTQVRRRPVRPQEMYVELPMEVGVGGGYFELVKFAEQLSLLPRLVTLNELRLQANAPGPSGTAQRPPAAGPPPGTVTAQLVAVVFQAQPASGGAADGAASQPPRP